ncbi:hypothetical protein U1Q18_003333 [Sarracenia purpurea var. burkii]
MKEKKVCSFVGNFQASKSDYDCLQPASVDVGNGLVSTCLDDKMPKLAVLHEEAKNHDRKVFNKMSQPTPKAKIMEKLTDGTSFSSGEPTKPALETWEVKGMLKYQRLNLPWAQPITKGALWGTILGLEVKLAHNPGRLFMEPLNPLRNEVSPEVRATEVGSPLIGEFVGLYGKGGPIADGRTGEGREMSSVVGDVAIREIENKPQPCTEAPTIEVLLNQSPVLSV